MQQQSNYIAVPRNEVFLRHQIRHAMSGKKCENSRDALIQPVQDREEVLDVHRHGARVELG